MTTTITKADALEMLELAVRERGEQYEYFEEFGGACHYAVDAPSGLKVGCIVGLGLHLKYGLSAMELRDLQGDIFMICGVTGRRSGEEDSFNELGTEDSSSDFAEIILEPDLEDENRLLTLFDLQPTESAIKILKAAQVAQDNRFNWGEAVARAEEVADLLEEA